MNLISYVVKFYFHAAWGGITMNSRCMDAADNKSVQPIKVLPVAALPVLLVSEMRACLLRPAYRIWHWEKTWSTSKGRDPTGKLCQQVFSVEAEHVFPYDCVVHT